MVGGLLERDREDAPDRQYRVPLGRRLGGVHRQLPELRREDRRGGDGQSRQGE